MADSRGIEPACINAGAPLSMQAATIDLQRRFEHFVLGSLVHLIVPGRFVEDGSKRKGADLRRQRSPGRNDCQILQGTEMGSY